MLFASLSHAGEVLDAWQADYNGLRPAFCARHQTPEEFRG